MRQKPNTNLCVLALLLALIFAFSAVSMPVLALAEGEPAFVDTYNNNDPLSLKAADLQGTACILMDRATSRVLFDKNADKKRYPASTTKIMTLLLALEYGHLNDIVTIPPEAADVPSDSSKTPVFPGEQMTFIDLLYGMMLTSGNDAANAVAVIVAGSTSDFAARMNERAKELGCTNTNFVNPHGYHDDNHYTTARDMALITREGLRHDTFRAISAAMDYTMGATSRRGRLRIATSNSMFVSSSKFYYKPLIGVKTGRHSKAGNCFVGAALQNGVYLISVTFHSTEDGRWMDTRRLMDYGYPKYRTYTFNDLYSDNPYYVSIENAAEDEEGRGMLMLDTVPGSTIEQYSITCLPEDYPGLLETYKNNMTIEYQSSLRAPIRRGDIIGTLKVPYSGGVTLQTTLIASRDVFEFSGKTTFESLFPWLEVLNVTPVKLFGAGLALIVLLLITLRMRRTIRKNRKRKQLYKLRMEAYESNKKGK